MESPQEGTMRGSFRGETNSPFARVSGWIRNIEETARRTPLLNDGRHNAPISEATPTNSPTLVPPASTTSLKSEQSSKGLSHAASSARTRVSRDPPEGENSIHAQARALWKQMDEVKEDVLDTSPIPVQNSVQESVSTTTLPTIPPPVNTIDVLEKTNKSSEPSEVSSGNAARSDRPHGPVYEKFDEITGMVGGSLCKFRPNIEGFDHPFRRGWVGQDQSNCGSRYKYYVVKQGYNPGIYSSYPGAWVRTADFQVNTRSPFHPRGIPPIMKGFDKYREAVAFFGRDPDEDPDPFANQHRPPPRIMDFADGCGPDPHAWCGVDAPSTSSADERKSKTPSSKAGTTLSTVVSSDEESDDLAKPKTTDPTTLLRQVQEALGEEITLSASASTSEEKFHRSYLSRVDGTMVPSLPAEPDRVDLGKFQMQLSAKLKQSSWLVDGQSILLLQDGPNKSPEFELRTRTLCRVLIEGLSEHHSETLERFDDLIEKNYGVSLFWAILDHLGPRSQSNTMSDFKTFCTRIHKNGETIHALARDLKLIGKRLTAASFTVTERFLTLTLVRAVLDGDYSQHEAFREFTVKLVHEDLNLETLSFDTFVTKVLNVMTNAELHVNGAAVPLPASAIVRRMNGGSNSDAWFGQFNLDRFSALATFDMVKCPICRVRRGERDSHFMTECPIAKECGYSIHYDSTKDNRRNRKEKGATEGAPTERARQAKDTNGDNESVGTDTTGMSTIESLQEKAAKAQRAVAKAKRDEKSCLFI